MAVAIRYSLRFTTDEFDALLQHLLTKGNSLGEVREALLQFFPKSLHDRIITQHRSATAVPASVVLMKPALEDLLVPEPNK